MRTETEKKYILKAFDTFKKRVIVVSPKFKILAASCPMEGISECDIIGRRCYEVFYDRTLPCENCAVEEVSEKHQPALSPKPDFVLQTQKMPCYYAYPIYSGDKIEAFVSMDFDIPTYSRFEEKLKNTTALLRNLLLSSPDCVIAADRKGRILIFNEAATKVFGYSENEVLQDMNIRNIYPDGLAHEIMRKLRSDGYGGKGKLRKHQVELLNKSGEKIPISLNAAIVYEYGNEVATIGFFHDLREELKIKEELEKTQIQLLQSEKMSSLGKLAAGVAHQLNNPLGGITLFTKIIMEEYELGPEVLEDLGRILKDAERCRDTVKELLEYTRQTKHFMRPSDINRAIVRTLFLLENQTLFHNIKIEKDLFPTLPHVIADIQQLNHVFMNLILNAVQAMEGKGCLTIKSRFLPNGDQISIEVADTGPGIPKEILNKVFEPFFTTKEEGMGTGLGLSLAYSIVENHGGKIKTKNKPGGGAKFTIELPVKNIESDKGD